MHFKKLNKFYVLIIRLDTFASYLDTRILWLNNVRSDQRLDAPQLDVMSLPLCTEAEARRSEIRAVSESEVSRFFRAFLVRPARLAHKLLYTRLLTSLPFLVPRIIDVIEGFLLNLLVNLSSMLGIVILITEVEITAKINSNDTYLLNKSIYWISLNQIFDTNMRKKTNIFV